MVSTSSGNIATIFVCIAALIHNYVNSDVVFRFYTCLSFPVADFQRRFSVGTQKSQRYDLVVIGGGSGGLACSKQGKFLRSPITLYQLEIYEKQNSTSRCLDACIGYYQTSANLHDLSKGRNAQL